MAVGQGQESGSGGRGEGGTRQGVGWRSIGDRVCVHACVRVSMRLSVRAYRAGERRYAMMMEKAEG